MFTKTIGNKNEKMISNFAIWQLKDTKPPVVSMEWMAVNVLFHSLLSMS